MREGSGVITCTVSEILIKKAGQTLTSPDAWLQEAPPADGAALWTAGHPEFELAKALFSKTGTASVPEELKLLLTSHPGLGPLKLVQGIPGYQVRLDGQPGGSQRCDLLAVATGREGRSAVVIEAWSDGGFGPIIADQLKRSRAGSQWVQRIEQLCHALFGKSAAECSHLRGGLIHRAAAALRAAEGEKSAVAVLVFYEFRRKDGRGQQRKGNLDSMDALATALGSAPLKDGHLSGPHRVPGGGDIPASVPLFIGRTVRLLP